MANNLSAVLPRLLAQGLMALREQAFVPRLVNSQYETIAGQKGSTIDVPIPSAIAAQDVTPANTPPNTADIAPTYVSVVMNNWKESAFYLTDKDMLEAMDGIIPMQASEAIKSLANAVNASILAQYVGFFGFVGTPGTTPFASDVSAATQARMKLNQQLAPMEPRNIILDPIAEANALGLQPISNQAWRAGLNESAIVSGLISKTLGFDWYMHQLTPTHTPGTAAGYLVNTASAAIGDKTIVVDTGTGTLKVGDIITFAGHTQTYVVTTLYSPGGSGTIAFYPGLKVAVPDNSAITVQAAHTVNLAFHRDAIAFATRPLQSSDVNPNRVFAAVDQDSGLTLRLEVSREYKRDRWSYDVLWGTQVIRPELGVRIAG